MREQASGKPYIAGRCGHCLTAFNVREEALEGGGLRAHFSCASCGRLEAVTFTARDLAAWAGRRRRRGGPAAGAAGGSGTLAGLEGGEP